MAKSAITVKTDGAAKAALKEIKEEIQKIKDELYEHFKQCPNEGWAGDMGTRAKGLEQARVILTSKIKGKKGGKK